MTTTYYYSRKAGTSVPARRGGFYWSEALGDYVSVPDDGGDARLTETGSDTFTKD